MINNYQQFGYNAGRLWNVINNVGCISEEEMMDLTNLREYEVCMAIGWLAREDKIRKDGEQYSISNTNLTYEIGENAGKIWRCLYQEGVEDAHTLLDKTNLSYREFYKAIGWLSRENKIKINLDKIK